MKYKISYQFNWCGGNIQYKTKQRVKRVIEEIDTAELLTTGLSREPDGIFGIAYIELPDDTDPEEQFGENASIQQIESVGSLSVNTQSEPRSSAVQKDRLPEASIRRFESSDGATGLIKQVNQSGGGGFVLTADLRPCDPFTVDRWFAGQKAYLKTVDRPLRAEDITGFYREHSDEFVELPTAYAVAYREPSSQTVTVTVANACTLPQLSASARHGVEWFNASNLHRFELSKAAFVVGQETHGPGSVGALFMSDDGDIFTSRALAYHDWWGEMEIHAHPLGLLVDGGLYRPVTKRDNTVEFVGEPVQLQTHRGGTSTPWQFGLTRTDGELLLTMARAGPEKFDPVVKRFDLEQKAIGDGPLVVSGNVSRRLWKEDPTAPAVTSSHSEGQRVRLLYRDADGWHLSNPDPSDGFPDAGSDTSFEETGIPGVEVYSTGIRSTENGDRKSTIEREYRLSEPYVADTDAAYVLVYHEQEEESMEELEWRVSDATAYKLTRHER